MTQHLIYTCDACADPKDVGDKARINVYTGYTVNPSTGSEDEYAEFDLCHACAVRILKQMCSKRTCVSGVQIDGARLAAWLKQLRKP